MFLTSDQNNTLLVVAVRVTTRGVKQQLFNPLDSATSNNMKSVHWPLMGGLLHLVQWGGDWAGPQPATAEALSCCTKCNSPPINGQCTYHCIMVRCAAVSMCPERVKERFKHVLLPKLMRLMLETVFACSSVFCNLYVMLFKPRERVWILSCLDLLHFQSLLRHNSDANCAVMRLFGHYLLHGRLE